MKQIRDTDLENRALAAYFRSAKKLSPALVDQPSMPEVWRNEEGKTYVLLPGGRGPGPCAVYRVRNDGMLKRLKRWPADLPNVD